MTTPASGRRTTARATTRVAIATLPLLALWGAGFNGVTPFYPTILVGAAAMVALTSWVWRSPDAAPPTAPHPAPDSAPVRGHPAPTPVGTNTGAIRFPAFAMSAAHAKLAILVAIAHYLVGLGLFLVAARTVPAFADTASTAYARAGSVPLWLAVLFGGVISAPLEELFWRGAFQPVVTWLTAQRSPSMGRQPLVGIAITAIGYAVFHAATLQLALVAAALLGGLVWGWLLHHTRSLGAVMLAHGAWTTLMLLLPPA